MGALGRALRRTGMVAATTAAFTLAGAGIASAHHCYKAEWQEVAYANLAEGTAWMPLGDLATMVIQWQFPETPEDCYYVGQETVDAWMEMKGLEVEPLIHSRATTGGGALYHKGKAPKPFDYLMEEDFMWLDAHLAEGLDACMAAQE